MKVVTMIAGVAVALSGLAMPSAASAQSGFYVGGSAGRSDFGNDADNGRITAGTVDAKDTGFKIFGGYLLEPEFRRQSAFEIAYVDFGKGRYSGTSVGNTITDGKFEIKGVYISGTGFLELDPSFAVTLKLGLGAAETRTTDVANGVPESLKETYPLFSYGIGLNYNLTKNVGLRAEWEEFWVGIAAPSLLSVGIAVRF